MAGCHLAYPPAAQDDEPSDNSPERCAGENYDGSPPPLVASPASGKSEPPAINLECEIARLLVSTLPQRTPHTLGPKPSPSSLEAPETPTDTSARCLFPSPSSSPVPSPPPSPPGFMAGRLALVLASLPEEAGPSADAAPGPRPSRKPRPVGRCRKHLALLSVRRQGNPGQYWERRPPLPGQRQPTFVNSVTGGVFGLHRTRHRDAEEERELQLALRLSMGDAAPTESSVGSSPACASDEVAVEPAATEAVGAAQETVSLPMEAPAADGAMATDRTAPTPADVNADPDVDAAESGFFSDLEPHGVCAFCQVDTRSRSGVGEFWAQLRQRHPTLPDRPLAAVAGLVGPILGPFATGSGSTGVKRQKRGPAATFWAHDLCLLWCPEVYELEEGHFVNLEQAHRRARKGMACNLCGRPGATLGCHVSSCRRNYHVLCALLAEEGVDRTNFVLFCPQHHTAIPQETE